MKSFLFTMKSFLFLILSLFALAANAQQNYYEFGWNNQYGIVDKDGNETLPPSYQWVSYVIDNESPFIVLNGNKGAVITNKQTGKTEKIDYFVFGHRHLPMVLDLDKTGSLYINLGDWISYFTYGVFDGQKFDLLEYK